MKKRMRRVLALWLAAFVLTLCACSGKADQTKAEQTAQTVQETAKIPEEKTPEEQTKQADVQPELAQETAESERETASEEANEDAVRPPMDELPEPEAQTTQETGTCTISISCASILEHLDALDPEKVELVPEDGWILAPTTVEFEEGQSVFDVLLATVKANTIHMEYQNTPMYETAYIEGIGNLYEFDCGALSGWMYCVNGWFPNYGCSRYAVQAGDVIEWKYTCDLGSDIGGAGVSQADE